MASKQLRSNFKRSVLTVALGICFTAGVHAQTNTSGAVAGHAASGDTITVTSPTTGFSRTVTVGSDGGFRVSSLPPGAYTITRTSADGQTSTRNVNVSVGTSSNADFVQVQENAASGELETVTVIGTAVNPIDVSSVESTTILTEAQIDKLPVPRNATSVALLAPGTVRGDARFGNLASFGGASVAENVYYINGFNVTNIVTGTAFNQLPFEALAEQQVKTGGYGAEFGRSLGGVINMVTKRGTNEWKFGANVFYSPDSLATGTRFANDPEDDGTYTVEEGLKTDSLIYNLYGGGPLVKDRLFMFALYQGQDETDSEDFLNGSSVDDRSSPQGLIKLDWNITDNHSLELTAFRDKRETEGTVYSRDDNVVGGGSPIGTRTTTAGGDNYVARWTGYITDSLTLSALYGKGEYSRGATDSNSAGCPVVVDARSSVVVGPQNVDGCWVDADGLVTIPDAGDERTAWRFDGEWALGDHLIRFGLDNEEFETVDGAQYSGGIYYRYVNLTPGQQLSNGYVVQPGDPTEAVRVRFIENGGTFLTKNSAWYLEDNWQITDNLRIYAGIRNESFENLNSLGGTFIDVSDTWAPRLGFSWDVNGDSTFKVFGNAGRYYIPVYANTNVRLAGSELDYHNFYTFTAIDPVTGVATLGEELGSRIVISGGGVPDPRGVVDNNLSPMYQDEYILGFQMQLTDLWSMGVRGIYRDLKSGMDDICNSAEPQAWALANGYSADQAAAIGDAVGHCFLTNPGKDLSANVDLDGTGELTRVDIPGSALGIPEAKRRYNALEIFFERGWDDKWFLQGSYTWAKSYGNTEGYVKSDIAQDDAGITQDFDFPGLTDGAYGYLPNDRRHSLKVFGAYQISDEWQVGANLLVQSGRPVNCFGVYPTGGPDIDGSGQYGVASFYCNSAVEGYPGSLRGRGTSGRVPWVQMIDLKVTYEPKWAEGLQLGVAVQNLFDSDDYYRVQENFEDEGGSPLPSYKQPRGYVAPRTVQFIAQYEFSL